MVALGVVPPLLAALNLLSPDFCECNPPYEIGASPLLMAGATGVRHAASASTVPAG